MLDDSFGLDLDLFETELDFDQFVSIANAVENGPAVKSSSSEIREMRDLLDGPPSISIPILPSDAGSRSPTPSIGRCFGRGDGSHGEDVLGSQVEDMSTCISPLPTIAGTKRSRGEISGEVLDDSSGPIRADGPTKTSDVDYQGVGEVVSTGNAGNFRLRGKSFHLTYRGHIDKSRLLQAVGGESCLDYWSVVWELGNHGASGSEPYEHTHFFFRAATRIERRNCRCFDIDGVHPHIQKVSGVEHEGRIYHEYHRKAPIQLWQSEANPPDPGLLRDRKRLRETLQRGSLLDAVLALGIEISSVSDVKAIREERVPPPPEETEYTEDDFSLKLSWTKMVEIGGKRMYKDVDSILLYGPSGMGKTERAVAFFKRPLLVRSLDQARFFHPDRYDGVVFDDVSLAHLSPEEKIHILDGSRTGSVKCRYSDGILPKGTKRIFTTNRTPNDFFTSGSKTHCEEQLAAFNRRVKIYHVSTPTYV